MLRGTITGEFADEKYEGSINECDMLFVFGFKNLGSKESGIEYHSQNITLGGGHPEHIMKCLAKSIIYQIGKMYNDDPLMAFAMIQEFKKLVSENVYAYMFDNLSEVLGGKEKKDGDCMGS